MDPMFSLQTTALACAATAVVGMLLVLWAISPARVHARNLRYVASMVALTLCVVTFFVAIPRYPAALWALIIWAGGARDALYLALMLVSMIVDFVVIVLAYNEAWKLGGDEYGTVLQN